MSKREKPPAPTRACIVCGADFEKNPRLSWKQWCAAVCCSTACRDILHGRRQRAARPSPAAIFAANHDSGDGCWNWTGRLDMYGYGVFMHHRRIYRAHVLALELAGRPVPPGLLACHTCDNPGCVNPAHLYAGTAQDNANDAVERHRLRVGEDHPRAKLSERDVREMRASGLSSTEASRRFGVSRNVASKILKGNLWRSVL